MASTRSEFMNQKMLEKLLLTLSHYISVLNRTWCTNPSVLLYLHV